MINLNPNSGNAQLLGLNKCKDLQILTHNIISTSQKSYLKNLED